MASSPNSSGLTQGFEQITQAVVVNLLHELQQLTDFTLGETLTRKPVEVVAGKSAISMPLCLP